MKKDIALDALSSDLDLEQEREKVLMLSCHENVTSFKMCKIQITYVWTREYTNDKIPITEDFSIDHGEY